MNWILWIVVTGTVVLAMISAVVLLDTFDEWQQQRRARKAFWNWIDYTDQRRRRV